MIVIGSWPKKYVASAHHFKAPRSIVELELVSKLKLDLNQLARVCHPGQAFNTQGAFNPLKLM